MSDENPDAAPGEENLEAAPSDENPDAAPGDGEAARRRETLRTVADDLRGETTESRQLAAILYRVSDLYDPAEDTSPEEIYRNVRQIMQVKARGGLDRE